MGRDSVGTSADNPVRSAAHGIDSLIVLRPKKLQYWKAHNICCQKSEYHLSEQMQAQLLSSQGESWAWELCVPSPAAMEDANWKRSDCRRAALFCIFWAHICVQHWTLLCKKDIAKCRRSAKPCRDGWGWSTCLVSRGWRGPKKLGNLTLVS